MTTRVISDIRQALSVHCSDKTRESTSTFFKEDVKAWGVPAAAFHRIGAKYFAVVKKGEKRDIFLMCESS